MTSLVDPRPLEPSWVSEFDSPGLLNIFTEKTYWDRDSRSFKTDNSNIEATPAEFLRQIQELIHKGDWSHEITFQIALCSTLDYSDILKGAEVPIDYIGLYWKLLDDSSTLAEGTCPWELLDQLTWATLDHGEGAKFVLHLSEDDPTP